MTSLASSSAAGSSLGAAQAATEARAAVAEAPPQAADAGAEAGPDTADRCANREVDLSVCHGEARRTQCFPLGRMGELGGKDPCFESNGCVQFQDLFLACEPAIGGP